MVSPFQSLYYHLVEWIVDKQDEEKQILRFWESSTISFKRVYSLFMITVDTFSNLVHNNGDFTDYLRMAKIVPIYKTMTSGSEEYNNRIST